MDIWTFQKDHTQNNVDIVMLIVPFTKRSWSAITKWNDLLRVPYGRLWQGIGPPTQHLQSYTVVKASMRSLTTL